MKKPLLLLLFLYAMTASAQIRPELTSTGFPAFEFPRPDRPNERLIELSRSWLPYYNRGEADMYDVTANSFKIDAVRDNAFFYRNRGEVYNHAIRYTLHVVFDEKTCRITFIVKDIFANNNTLSGLTVADFFAPDGRLKEDYEEVKPSLEATAASIVRSYINYINQ
ncbi:MAG TPA: hypothetical protein VGB50_08960 [Flavobacterium sp.]|jgi:hypothetical protein